ncbi:hypothetical protein ABIC83_005959 [Roseateles asaccharophilus]|uniref:Uncharacterized protein n=1 Tax=Roseateles asaccharophilus TaxID=582607 RepID=A0ABU2AFU3_9BURK|nr:hypothetical protein [Roseateles asaccharophilus]
MMYPSSGLTTLHAGEPSRSPEGTAIDLALSPVNIARRAGLGRPGARPEHRQNQRFR